MLYVINIHGDCLGELTNVSLGQTVETVLSLEQKVVCTAALSDAESFLRYHTSWKGHRVQVMAIMLLLVIRYYALFSYSDHHVAMRWCHAITIVKCKC